MKILFNIFNHNLKSLQNNFFLFKPHQSLDLDLRRLFFFICTICFESYPFFFITRYILQSSCQAKFTQKRSDKRKCFILFIISEYKIISYHFSSLFIPNISSSYIYISFNQPQFTFIWKDLLKNKISKTKILYPFHSSHFRL